MVAFRAGRSAAPIRGAARGSSAHAASGGRRQRRGGTLSRAGGRGRPAPRQRTTRSADRAQLLEAGPAGRRHSRSARWRETDQAGWPRTDAVSIALRRCVRRRKRRSFRGTDDRPSAGRPVDRQGGRCGWRCSTLPIRALRRVTPAVIQDHRGPAGAFRFDPIRRALRSVAHDHDGAGGGAQRRGDEPRACRSSATDQSDRRRSRRPHRRRPCRRTTTFPMFGLFDLPGLRTQPKPRRRRSTSPSARQVGASMTPAKLLVSHAALRSPPNAAAQALAPHPDHARSATMLLQYEPSAQSRPRTCAPAAAPVPADRQRRPRGHGRSRHRTRRLQPDRPGAAAGRLSRVPAAIGATLIDATAGGKAVCRSSPMARP